MAQDFEALYNEDPSLIDLITNDEIRALLLQTGGEKYDLLFGKALSHCVEWLGMIQTYLDQRVPYRMFVDLMRFVHKKMVDAKLRAVQLTNLSSYMCENDSTGSHRVAIACMTDSLVETLRKERAGYQGPPDTTAEGQTPQDPSRSAEDWSHPDLSQSSEVVPEEVNEKEAVRMAESAASAKENVPARQNDRGSVTNDYAFRIGHFTKPLAMSTAQHTAKVRRIIDERQLAVVTTQELLDEEPAKLMEADHQAFSDAEIIVHTFGPDDLLPKRHWDHCREPLPRAMQLSHGGWSFACR